MATEYVKIEGLDGLVKRLKAFPKEMSQRGGPIRSALARGGKIIRDEAKANVRALIAEPNDNGMDSESTGLLEKSVIQKRHRDPRSFAGASEVYQVKVKRRTSAKGVSVTRYGKILEFGSEHIKAFAWLRRAAESKRQVFFQTVATELGQGIAKIERKLGALK